jgi:antitoxin component YwqK of YwqJK toxin-antitoxin module
MKRILSLIGVVLVVGCGPEPIDVDELVNVFGVHQLYLGEPYSGPVFKKSGDVITMTGSLKDGKFDGLYEEFWENGQRRRKETLKDGERDGLWENYYDNGQVMVTQTYKDGQRDGPYERYINSGDQLLEKGTYKDGQKCGEWFEGAMDGEMNRITVTYDPC